MGERLQWNGHPDHRPDERPPDPGRAHDDVRLDLALIGHDRADPAVVGADPGHGVAAEEPGAALGRAAGLRFGHADGLGEPVGRDVVGAEDGVAVDERPQAGGLVRVDHPALDAPRLGEPLPTMELAEPVLGQRELEAADLVEAPLPVELERARLLDRVPRELGHGLGTVGLEHEPGRMRRRAAGREQRPLLDDDDVRPAAQHELVGQGTADDPGTDDRDAGSRAKGGPPWNGNEADDAFADPRRGAGSVVSSRTASRLTTRPRARQPTACRRPPRVIPWLSM